MIHEIAHTLWQTPGVTGVALWQSNSRFHLFTKRRLPDWEKQEISKMMSQKLSEYAQNPDISQFRILGDCARLYIAFPYPPLIVLTQTEEVQLPYVVSLYFAIQQDAETAIAILQDLAAGEVIRSSRKINLGQSVAKERERIARHVVPEADFIEKTVTITELVEAINELTTFCAKYIGPTMTIKYLEKNRTDDAWLANFAVDKSLKVTFKGNPNENVTIAQTAAIEGWVKNFLKDSSSIFKDLPKLILKSSIKEQYFLSSFWKNQV